MYRLLKFRPSLKKLCDCFLQLIVTKFFPVVTLTQGKQMVQWWRKNTEGWNHSGCLNSSCLNEVTFFSENASESPNSDFVKHTKMLQTHLPVAKGVQAVKSVVQLPRCAFSLSICSWCCWRQDNSLAVACCKIVALVISPLLCQMSGSLCIKKSLILEASAANSKSPFF